MNEKSNLSAKDEKAGKAIISAHHLRKSYKNTTAVSDFTLDIEEGGVFSLLGVNGAGKTTTIKMLTGLTKPDSGDGTIYSLPIGDGRLKPLIGISPQETSTAGNLTVEENLILTGEIYGLGKSSADKADEVIRALNLGDHRHKLSKQLSGGLRRRLSIGMGLIHSPRVLFLDEPTLGLDVIARRELWELIKSLEDKMTVILTTHYMEEAQALSRKIAVMSKGKVIASGTLDELRNKANLPGGSLEDVFLALSGAESGKSYSIKSTDGGESR